MTVFILRKHKEKQIKYDQALPPCPICGSKAFIQHDVVDGFEFGYSVGCPRACINDGIHNLNTYESFNAARIVLHQIPTKEKAIKLWVERCNQNANVTN